MFSIIVPSYNRIAEVEALLASLCEQSLLNFEVIIVDDHSKQPLKIDKTYPFPVQLIRNEINLGAAESRNQGAKIAQHEWLLFLDDDDRFLPQKCEILTSVIQQNDEVNFLYHPAKCKMVNEGFSYFTSPYKNINELTLDNILLANKIGGMPMLAIKKNLFLQVGGLSNQLRSLEDYEFLLKLLKQANFRPHYVAEVLTCCYFHTKRSSVSTNTTHTEQAIDYIQQYYIETDIQRQNFALNRLYMLAYPHIMNFSRQAAKYYFEMFKISKKIKPLIIAMLIFISPQLAIQMKRFI